MFIDGTTHFKLNPVGNNCELQCYFIISAYIFAYFGHLLQGSNKLHPLKLL